MKIQLRTLGHSLACLPIDTLRATLMRALLADTGRGSIWTYTVIPARTALVEALKAEDMVSVRCWKWEAKYALVGPGMHFVYFRRPCQLADAVIRLCTHPKGPMSRFARRSLSDNGFPITPAEAREIADRIVEQYEAQHDPE